MLPRTVLLTALLYAGASVAWRTGHANPLLTSGAWQATLLFGAGMLPLATIVLFFALVRPNASERRVCVIGAAISALMLIPLMRLVF